eukprot:TRINITY_DN100985_c0_g1_i1.p1 TRINITY_DN100985_c0_g1~~TRINITY_DN100985_c0_g1_i1.p1  ORF type:complete len:914 (+),score=133.82 TRINITY_DN100985_c0_g1_i1:100-2841(+)
MLVRRAANGAGAARRCAPIGIQRTACLSAAARADKRGFSAAAGENQYDACKVRLPASGLHYYDLSKLNDARVETLPLCVRVLLEASLRTCDGKSITPTDVESVLAFAQGAAGKKDINWKPPRVIMQDLSGIPALIDLCAMREAIAAKGGDPSIVNPLSPVDLVVDHSVIVDVSGTADALRRNEEIELQRNRERFEFLKWAQSGFKNFTLVPPGSGIIHQVHCENLARVVMVEDGIAFADACVGTDSHTPMVNGLGVLGWGVGGIEAEAAMLGQPMSMVLPEVVGLELTGELQPGVMATDLVLTVTELLRRHGVVGKFVEIFGPAASSLAVTDRMTIANMAPEYGATAVFFPTDNKTLEYLRTTGRPEATIDLVREHMTANGLFGASESGTIKYSSVAPLDLSTVVPCVAGPKRPQDRVPLPKLKEDFTTCLTAERGIKGFGLSEEEVARPVQTASGDEVRHGQLAIAAITSCTNTSNPSVLIGAGLVAKKAVEKGLSVPPHVKTSLAPGSRVVTKYLEAAGLQTHLDSIGFQTVGYGCTTCMGNSGEVKPIMQEASDSGAITAAVLSGNRNFEGRVHLSVKAAYLASPPLVVAAALSGRVDIDFEMEPLGQGTDGPVYLRDIWPTPEEIDATVAQFVRPDMFKDVYSTIQQSSIWDKLEAPKGVNFQWQPDSTYITRPPFLDKQQSPMREAFCLLLMGDSVTTDHISPVSSIKTGPAFEYLQGQGVGKQDMSSFGARRGNSNVMVRGTFANPRVFNQLVGEAGPQTVHIPSGETMHVFDASQRYQADGHDLIVIAGEEYGTGSSRDWAAKGTSMLGIRAVLAKSFERIHRSNLVGMGVLPLAFEGASELGLTGREKYQIHMPSRLSPGTTVQITATGESSQINFEATVRLDTDMEVEYWQQGGIMQYVLGTLA